MTMAIPEVLDLNEVAALLRLSSAMVLHEAREGRLPGRRIGEEWRFARVHVPDWLRGDVATRAPADIAGAQQAVEIAEDRRGLAHRTRGWGQPDAPSTC